MCLYWKPDGPDLVVIGMNIDDLLYIGTSADAVYCFFGSLALLSIKTQSSSSSGYA